MKVKIFSETKTQESIEVAPAVLKVTLNPNLLTQAVQRQLANRRRPIAHTKNRDEVSGGGRKPFRQKGTGRARAGSTRSPIWIGGGVTFGPRNVRNFHQKLPQKMRQRAIAMALSEKLKNNQLIVVKSLELPKIGTGKVQAFLEKLPIKEGKILVILSRTNVNFELSAANLPFIKIIQIQNINILDLLKYDYILTDVEAIKTMAILLKEEK